MKTKTREVTEQDLNEFFIQDSDGDFLKQIESEKEYDREPDVENAQIFTEAEAMDIINENPNLYLKITMVGDILNPNDYEIEYESKK